MENFNDEMQTVLANRATNPTVQDVNRLYETW